MRPLYVRLDYTTFEAKPQAYDVFEHLSINGQTFSFRWETVFDAGETWDRTNNPYSPNTGYDYYEREVGSATFVNPGSQELATYTTFDGRNLNNWTTIYVADDFTIPISYDNGPFGSFVKAGWEDAKNSMLIYLIGKGYSTATYAKLLNDSSNLYKFVNEHINNEIKLIDQVTTGQIDLATFEKNSVTAANDLLINTTTLAFNIPSILVEAVKHLGIQYSVKDPSFPNVTPYIDSTESGEMQGTLFQGQQNERFLGSFGNDRIDGLYGDDVVLAGFGNDTVFGSNGNDIYSGGPGIDTLTYEKAQNPVGISLASGLASFDGFGSQDRIVGFENVIGGFASDLITGDARANTLSGLGGDDQLAGGAGRDRLDGGAGSDTADYLEKTGSISVVLNGDTYAAVTVGGVQEDQVRGVENVFGGSGNDVLIGDGRDNYLYGASGNDKLRGGGGLDWLNGGPGTDTATYADKTAGIEVTLNDGQGQWAAVKIGGVYEDYISDVENVWGGSGNDTIVGDSNGNVLQGSAGRDVLTGGGGRDVLTGGPGADIFQYFAITDSGITAATRDVITDFQHGIDKIDLSRIDANATNAAGTNDAFTFIGPNVKFHGAPGELRAYWTATDRIIEGDINGDAKADFSIALQDVFHAIPLTSTDFLL